MGRRVVVHSAFRGRAPSDWGSWAEADGPLVAASRTTETRRIERGGIPLHLKRYRYSPGSALRGSLRNTLLRPSRAAREFRMLDRFRERAGPEIAPAPVAFGERRVLGFLREAFLATETVPGGAPLSERVPPEREAARRLGRFLARLHGAGLVHGSLFARNLLVTEEGAFRVVDLDRARTRASRSASGAARDLARLDESLPGMRAASRLRALHAYLGGGASRDEVLAWIARIDRHRPEARARLRARLGMTAPFGERCIPPSVVPRRRQPTKGLTPPRS